MVQHVRQLLYICTLLFACYLATEYVSPDTLPPSREFILSSATDSINTVPKERYKVLLLTTVQMDSVKLTATKGGIHREENKAFLVFSPEKVGTEIIKVMGGVWTQDKKTVERDTVSLVVVCRPPAIQERVPRLRLVASDSTHGLVGGLLTTHITGNLPMEKVHLEKIIGERAKLVQMSDRWDLQYRFRKPGVRRFALVAYATDSVGRKYRDTLHVVMKAADVSLVTEPPSQVVGGETDVNLDCRILGVIEPLKRTSVEIWANGKLVAKSTRPMIRIPEIPAEAKRYDIGSKL